MKGRTVKLIVRVYIPLALLIGLVFALIWGNGHKRNALRYEQQIGDVYAQFFHDLADNFAQLETSLAKITATASNEQATLLLSEIWRIAGECVATLGQVPTSYDADRELNTFLTQLSDFAHTRLESLALGVPLTKEDHTQFETLHRATIQISKQLQQSREKGETLFSIQSLAVDGSSQNANDLFKSGSQSNEGSDRYPHLIYDGPFSDSTTNATPKGLGEELYDPAAAMEVARITLGDQLQGELIRGDDQDGRIAAYLFQATTIDQRPVEIAITKKGGSLLWMRIYDTETVQASQSPTDTMSLSPSASASPDMSGEPIDAQHQGMSNADLSTQRQSELVQTAQNYLREIGYDSMEGSYSQSYDGKMLINMVYVQDGVLIYNDQIKLWIEIQTGRVVGVDTENYLFSHTQRTIPPSELTPQQAQQKLADHLQVERVKRALIPININEERFCYEFTCTYQQQTFLIYINAVTGQEEKILKVVDSEIGKLLL